jgi:hypothetical protein
MPGASAGIRCAFGERRGFVPGKLFLLLALGLLLLTA